MIEEFTRAWFANIDRMREGFSVKHPDSYREIVEAVIKMLSDALEDDFYALRPDPERIHEIDDGDYQGTLLYVIGDCGYQPSNYWYVKVSYGSCSGCDTLQGIHEYSSEKPTEDQVSNYMTLARHIIQGLTVMGTQD